MDLSKLDLVGLGRALDDHDPDRETWLDLETGSLWTFVFSESTDETRKRRDEVTNEPRHRLVPSMTTQEAYEEIEDFVETVADVGRQDELFRALEKKGALRNFRETLLKYPDERLRWSNLRREQSRKRLEAFLKDLGLSREEIPVEMPRT